MGSLQQDDKDGYFARHYMLAEIYEAIGALALSERQYATTNVLQMVLLERCWHVTAELHR